jgi:hypothetical protein
MDEGLDSPQMALLRARPKLVAALAVVALFIAGAAYQAVFGSRSSLGLHVEGDRLVDEGRVVRLLGVDWPGEGRACAEGKGALAGPSGRDAVRALLRWRINAVRIPLNEDCWLAPGGTTTGAAYRDGIAAFVERLHAAGLYVILDLDRSPQPLADAARSPRFWSEVAKAYKHDRRVVFDLYDEPHDVDWFCWRDGCTSRGGVRLAGMQQLVDAVRDAGAKQPLMIAGLDGGNDLRRWVDLPPFDPESQLVASFHVDGRSRCATARCWDGTVARVARRVPVVTAEVGDRDCRTAFAERFARWADAHGVSYLGSTSKAGLCAALERHLAKQDVRLAPD